ncbi:MAG: serine/threonine-protein kinase [Myxococcota bacterium]
MSTSSERAGFGATPRSAKARDPGLGRGRSESPPPERLGRYVVLREIGRGGMGVVWTAYDPKLDRKVAIKLLKRSARRRVLRARFVREARALARINHPNIITVHDVGTHEGQLYMAMEYVRGQTLERWMRQERGVHEILEVFDKAGQGLAAAHDEDLTHRDFKPSNVLIDQEGRVKVLDFGLAKPRDHAGSEEEDGGRDSERDSEPDDGAPGSNLAVLGASTLPKLTQVGRVLGTPGYMAPEQFSMFDRREIGAWTDQFSFGITLYQALYGDRPFGGDDLHEIYENIRYGRIREPRRDSAVPGWVFRVVQRALRYEPAHRYPSMELLLADLRADPIRRRRRRLAYTGGLGVLGLLALGVVRTTADDEGPRPCQGARERLAGVWDDPARASVRQGLVATEELFAADTARRVVDQLDRYAEAWVEQHTATCEATRIHGEQSDALLDVRMTCLDRRRGELSALVQVLSRAKKETVASAMTAAVELRRPEPCALAQRGIESEVPEDPAEHARFLALRERVDGARALLSAGNHLDARDQAAAAGQSAAEAGFARLQAESLIIEGTAYRSVREPSAAQQRLRQGIVVASEVGDARTEFAGWNDLLYIAGVSWGDAQQAEDWQFAAQTALRHVGSPAELEFKLALTQSAVMVALDRLDQAAHHGEQAHRIALDTTGPGSLQLALALNNLGIVAAEQANWSLAERRLRDSYVLMREILGPKHPEVASRAMNLASVLTQYAEQLEDGSAVYDEAERLFDEVVSFREDSEGPRSKSVARALVMLGLLQRNRGKLAQARVTHERARDLLRARPEAELDLAGALGNLAEIERLEHNYERAESYHREALELQRARLGDQHPAVGKTRLELCRLLEQMERHAMALPECERALAIMEVEAEDGADGRARQSLVSTHILIARVAEALGRREQAAKHRAHADALRGSPPPEPLP